MKKVHLTLLAILSAVLAFIVAALGGSAQAQEQEHTGFVSGVRFDEVGGINTSLPREQSDVSETIVVTGYRRSHADSPYPANGTEAIVDSSFGPTVTIYRLERGPFFAQIEVVDQSAERYRGPDFSNRLPHVGFSIPTPIFEHLFERGEE